MKKPRRKTCDGTGTQCTDPAFFRQPAKSPAVPAPFFSSTSPGDAPTVQKQEAKGAEEEKKDPVTEGLKTVGENLAENESFKKWYEPRLESLKFSLWDKASPADKAAMITFLGFNAGAAGLAFASSPQLRQGLSGVNIGKPLGWIPYSPLEGFTYKLPGEGKKATEVSADFTFNPYLEAWKNRPKFLPSGATFGLDSSYDPAGGGFNLTGGKFGLDFLGGGLKAEGKTFNSLSPYPQLMLGRDGVPPAWLMQQIPGSPDMKTGPGFQFMLNADLLKLFPHFKKHF